MWVSRQSNATGSQPRHLVFLCLGVPDWCQRYFRTITLLLHSIFISMYSAHYILLMDSFGTKTFPSRPCTGITGQSHPRHLFFRLGVWSWPSFESGNARPDVCLTHRRKKAAGGSRSGSSHKPVAPRGSVCIRGHTGRTPWSRWTGRCSTAPRWPGYRDPCKSTCPVWPLQECQSTENFLNRFWATKEIKACYDAEQRCENYIQEIFTGLSLAYKCYINSIQDMVVTTYYCSNYNLLNFYCLLAHN